MSERIVPQEKLNDRANIIFTIQNWFEKEKQVSNITVVLHDRALASSDDVGAIFGMCVNQDCPICDLQEIHVHISLLSAFEFYEREQFGIKESDNIGNNEWKGMVELDLVRTTLEEFFHYWQSVTYPRSYLIVSAHSPLDTKDSYHQSPIEIEAKSFAASETERYVDAAYNKAEERDFFKDILRQIREL